MSNHKRTKEIVINRASEIFDNFIPNYQCNHCMYTFSDRSSMRRHIINRCKQNIEKNTDLPITHCSTKMALEQSRDEYIKDNGFVLHKNILSSVQEVHDIRSRGFQKTIRRPRNIIDAYEFLKLTNTVEWFMNGECNKVSYAMERESKNLPYFHLPIVNIVDAGEEYVYDIEVEHNHSFLANGLVVHNCQQRQRRFRSALEKDEEEFKKFDSNSLTPGTLFMDRLTKYIDWYIRHKMTTELKWQKIEVVFSDEKVAGEGEHKLLNYIRKHGNKNDTYCIHGLDADLIMLALGTHLPNFWILRDDLYNPRNEFFVLDIGRTRVKL